MTKVRPMPINTQTRAPMSNTFSRLTPRRCSFLYFFFRVGSGSQPATTVPVATIARAAQLVITRSPYEIAGAQHDLCGIFEVGSWQLEARPPGAGWPPLRAWGAHLSPPLTAASSHVTACVSN